MPLPGSMCLNFGKHSALQHVAPGVTVTCDVLKSLATKVDVLIWAAEGPARRPVIGVPYGCRNSEVRLADTFRRCFYAAARAGGRL